MNERIKQLADKIWAEEYWTDPNTDKLLPAQLNRFAKLIVRECVAVIEPGEFMQGTAHDDTKKIITLNQRKIRKHFGVDE
jgi:hypothetical protein